MYKRQLAGLSALGQVLAYDFYIRKQEDTTPFVGRMIVTDYVRHYMPQLWSKYGIWVVVLPVDGAPEIIPPGGEGQAPPPVKLPEEV